MNVDDGTGRGAAGDATDYRLTGAASLVNRLLALGIVAYLYLHLGLLSMLVRGPNAWDAFVDLASSPPFLALDAVLLAGILVHAVSGIRVGVVGMGLIASRTRAWLVALAVIAALVALVAVLRIPSGT